MPAIQISSQHVSSAEVRLRPPNSTNHGAPTSPPGGISQRLQNELKVSETQTGKGVRVQTEQPHLVSLGGGRLSTAVTLLPLPPGETTIGTLYASVPQDIVVQGTGVDDQHCYIANSENVVTIHPIAVLCSIDGRQINKPTRLTQGCMICLGRSNYFRFNHPEEAQRMKNALPNSRISVTSVGYLPRVEPSAKHQNSPPTDRPLQTKHNQRPVRIYERKIVSINNKTDDQKCNGSTDKDKKKKHRDSLEGADFVNKVSRFEFLTHAASSPPTSPTSPKPLGSSPLRSPTRLKTPPASPRSPRHNSLPRSPTTAQATAGSTFKSPSFTKTPPPSPKSLRHNSLPRNISSSESHAYVQLKSPPVNRNPPPSPRTPRRHFNLNAISTASVSLKSPETKTSEHCEIVSPGGNSAVVKSNKSVSLFNRLPSPSFGRKNTSPKSVVQVNNSPSEGIIRSPNSPLFGRSSSSSYTDSVELVNTGQSDTGAKIVSAVPSSPSLARSPQSKPPAVPSSPLFGRKSKVASSSSSGNKSPSIPSSPLFGRKSKAASSSSSGNKSPTVPSSPLFGRKSKAASSSNSGNKSPTVPSSPLFSRKAKSPQTPSSPSLSRSSLGKLFKTPASPIFGRKSQKSPPSPGDKKIPPPVPAKPKRRPPLPNVASSPTSPDSKVTLRDSIQPNLENFKGEKVFTKDTIVTRVVLSGLERNDCGHHIACTAVETAGTSNVEICPVNVTCSDTSKPITQITTCSVTPVSSTVLTSSIDTKNFNSNISSTAISPVKDNLVGTSINRPVVSTQDAQLTKSTTEPIQTTTTVALSNTVKLTTLPPSGNVLNVKKINYEKNGSIATVTGSTNVTKVEQKQEKLGENTITTPKTNGKTTGAVKAIGSASKPNGGAKCVTFDMSTTEDKTSTTEDKTSTRDRVVSGGSTNSSSSFTSVSSMSSSHSADTPKGDQCMSVSPPRFGVKVLPSSPTNGFQLTPTKHSPSKRTDFDLNDLQFGLEDHDLQFGLEDLDLYDNSSRITSVSQPVYNIGEAKMNGGLHTVDNGGDMTDDTDSESLTGSQQDLKQLHKKMVEERKKEQEMAEFEQKRLEEILNMCAEYEKQIERERTTKGKEGLGDLKLEGILRTDNIVRSESRNSMTKIKTNGSLTKLTSPGLTHKDTTFEFWKRRSSNSSASEEDLGSENGTIKRRPNGSGVELNGSITPTNHSASSIGASRVSESSSKLKDYNRKMSESDSVFDDDHVYDNVPFGDDSKEEVVEHVLVESLGTKSEIIKPLDDDITRTMPDISPISSSSDLRSPRSTGSDVGKSLFGMESEPGSMHMPQSRDAITPSSSGIGTSSENSFNLCEETDLKLQLEKCKQQKTEAIHIISHLKQQIVEIETQENEAIRELEMERALLEGEHQVEMEQLKSDQDKINILKQKQLDLIECATIAREKEFEKMEVERLRLDELEAQYMEAEHQLENCMRGEEEELRRRLQKQHELLEQQKKVFDDLEFQQLEVETRYDEEHEKIQQQLVKEEKGLLDKYKERQEKLQHIDRQQQDMLRQVKADIEELERDRQKLVEEFRKEKMRLSSLEKRMREFTRLLALPGEFPNEHNEIDVPNEGDSVIEEERKRLYQLQQRAAHEVRVEWEQRKKEKSTD